MQKRKTKAERKPAKSANSEQRFTIHEIEQAKEVGYQAGYRAAMAAAAAQIRALGLTAQADEAITEMALDIRARIS